MGKRAPDELRYTAFLSYSHRDAAAAGRLHRRLEAYRMPRRLVGQETPRGPVPERLAPIFRDREELPAATDLSQTVREALGQSGALIILCSPNAAGSLWVAEEIRVFRELQPDRPILAAVLDGDPPDCFPEALRAFGADGTWHEPLATDLRPQCDGPRLGLLKLVAGVTGIGLDALVQRDASRRIRRVMAVTVGALVALLVTAALALAALSARREAERQRAQAEGLIVFMLTDLREKLSGVGRLEIMTAVNQRALSYYDQQLALNDRAADSAMRARIKHAIGEDLMARHDWPAALANFREAHRITSSLIGRLPNDANAIFAHAQSEYWLGRYAYEQHNSSAARLRFEQYKALAGRLLAIDAANPQWLREAGYAEGNICVLDLAAEESAGRAAMPQSCVDALSFLEQAWSARRGDPSFIAALANRHGWMTNVWNALGNWDRVLMHRRRHEELVKELIRRDPANVDYRDIWMRSQFGFGELLAARGQRREAQARFADAAATAAFLRARDPDNAGWRDFQRRIATAMATQPPH